MHLEASRVWVALVACPPVLVSSFALVGKPPVAPDVGPTVVKTHAR
jgi:hypothetical protein